MKTTDETPALRVTARAKQILEQSGIRQNPYLQALRDGTMPLEEFRRSQEQFFFAVTFFPRPMAALVGRIPNPKSRLDILHNLVEEHGEFNEKLFHHTTFQQFLRSIGGVPEKIEATALSPALRAFNSILTSACVLDELEVGVACMGIIEYAFAGMSATIGQAVVQRGWVKQAELVHYALHAQIDERHAAEFFAVIEPNWPDPARRYFIEQGLELGAYAFDRLYRELYALGAASQGRNADHRRGPQSAPIPPFNLTWAAAAHILTIWLVSCMAQKRPIRVRRSQEKRRDESRAKILAAAERIFARDGLAGARTDAIAADAGVNKALLYYYFKGKDSLYEAVIAEHLGEFNSQALPVLQAPGPAPDLLLRYVKLHFDFISRQHRHASLFQQLMMKGGKAPERLFRDFILPRAEALRKLLARGMRAGEFRKADPFHTAVSIAALIVFYFSATPMLRLMIQADPYAAPNLKRRKQEVVEFIQQALFIGPNAHAA